jgi:hypothetical protein
MVQVGDLDEKALIMLGTQLGIRVGDFVQLKRRPILEAYLNSNGVFPLQFEIETEKEGVLSMGHISKDVYETLKLYWAQVPKSDYVFPSNNGRDFISVDRANDIIKNTWRKAFPDRRDVMVRFHELRSYKISTLANFGVNEWIIKKMTGKKISSDMNGYLTSLDLKDAFMKALEALTLTQGSDRSQEAMEKLKKEIDLKVEEQVDERIRVLQRLIDRYANENMDLKDRLGKTEKGLSELREILQQLLEK